MPWHPVCKLWNQDIWWYNSVGVPGPGNQWGQRYKLWSPKSRELVTPMCKGRRR